MADDDGLFGDSYASLDVFAIEHTDISNAQGSVTDETADTVARESTA